MGPKRRFGEISWNHPPESCTSCLNCRMCLGHMKILWWWLSHPYEKYESQLGLVFSIYGKIKIMFQTTNQSSCLIRMLGAAWGPVGTLVTGDPFPACDGRPQGRRWSRERRFWMILLGLRPMCCVSGASSHPLTLGSTQFRSITQKVICK